MSGGDMFLLKHSQYVLKTLLAQVLVYLYSIKPFEWFNNHRGQDIYLVLVLDQRAFYLGFSFDIWVMTLV